MRILFYSSYFHPYISGLTRSPERILSNLSKKNDISVLTFPHKKNLGGEEHWQGMNIIRMPYLFKISKGYISPQSFFYFSKELNKAEIVFLNLPNVEGLALAIFAKICNKKIISLYNCEVNLGPNILQKFISKILNASVFLQLLLSETIITYPDYIQHRGVGKFFKGKLDETLPIISKYRADKKALEIYKLQKKDNIWIGFVGRIAREKGIEYLIEAIKALRINRHSGMRSASKIDLIFAGPPPNEVVGEKNYFDTIKKLLQDKNISYRFLGKLSDEELAAFYKSIDILVLPSINHTEAFGMVQAEAMLHGTPVVASNLPGVRIPIQKTKMGLLVEPREITQLTDALLEILENKKAYTNINLVKNARAFFDSKKIYKFYENLIEN